MNKTPLLYLLGSSLLMSLLLFQACQPKGGDSQNVYRDADITDIAPDMSDRVFENDYVKATVISIPFEQDFPAHTANDRLIFALNKFKLEADNGSEASSKTYEEGEVNKLIAGQYSFKNVGINPVRFLSITRNSGNLNQSNVTGTSNGITKVAPGQSSILMEDEKSRMIEVDLAPGSSIPVHDALPRMVYTLNSAEVKFLHPIEGAQKFWATRGSQGEIIWLDSGQYRIVNTSKRKPARFIMVGYKK